MVSSSSSTSNSLLITRPVPQGPLRLIRAPFKPEPLQKWICMSHSHTHMGRDPVRKLEPRQIHHSSSTGVDPGYSPHSKDSIITMNLVWGCFRVGLKDRMLIASMCLSCHARQWFIWFEGRRGISRGLLQPTFGNVCDALAACNAYINGKVLGTDSGFLDGAS